MLTVTKFNTLIRNIICLLVLVAMVLVGMLELKNLYMEPSILVLQSKFDGSRDRIVKIKDNLSDFETIFEAPDIQDFGATKTQLLVTTGQKDKESGLQLVNIKSKAAKALNYPGKYVSEIVAGGDKFVLLVEDVNSDFRTYKSKLGMIVGDSLGVQDLNPQFLASAAYSIFINPSGSLLVFSGVANNQYVVDLDNPQSAIKLDTDTKLTLGFVNEKQLTFTNYLAVGGVQVEVLDLSDDQTKTYFLGNEQYNQIVVGPQAINYTQSKEINGVRVNGLKANDNSSLYFIPGSSFENIKLSATGDFLLFEKTNVDNLVSSFKRYESSPNKSFAIYHLKTKYLGSSSLEGVKAVWAK
jgi:hypothetical protein